MKHPEIHITCVFSETGESIQQILVRFFQVYLSLHLAGCHYERL